ncbi:MAG TPA: glycosyl hydrolase [Chitinophagaceae bacterium]
MKIFVRYQHFFQANFLVISCVIFMLAMPATAQQRISPQIDLRKIFLSPPESASPWVFWYWHLASVSKEGITADLNAMKEAGIGGAYLMTIKGPASPPLMDSTFVQLSPEWWDMIRFAVQESKRTGIKLGFHVSDGFALAGGPWITPQLSMQKVVWSEKNIRGGLFNEILTQPETLEGYYRDIAVFAYPSPPGSGSSTRTDKPVITSSKTDSAVQFLTEPGNVRTFGCDEQCWIQYQFAEPFTCRSIVISSRNNYQSNRLIIEVSDDGKQFRSVGRMEPPRHGWQDWDSDYTHVIPATTAKYFRFVFDKTGTEPGAEDLDAAKWRPSLRIRGIELSGEPRLHQYEGKNGEVWRISKITTSEQVPDSICIRSKDIIDLTDRLDSNGRLNWNAPPGEWTILRMGHTSTGHKNETAGGGKGLECDKFNPVAISLQYEKWFGEIIKQVGPDLAGEVIKKFHVDSWECGSQNWSPGFREEFRTRRGYDLLPFLPAMAGIPVENAAKSEQFLHDIRKTIAELVADKFYTTLSQLAKKNGLLFSAESVAPTMVSDGLLHYKHVDLPMGEFWLRSPTHDKPNDMLDAISAAHIYGKQIVQAESFTQLRMAWDEHPGMLKALGDRNLALGINRIFFHVFMHNPWMDRKPGMTLDAIGLYFQRDQTWWKQSRGWIDYLKRCQALLQIGYPVADVAVFTGEEIPARSVLPDRLVPVLPGIFGKEKVENEKKRLENIGQPQRQLPAGVNHSANMADPENWIDPLNGYSYDSFNSDALLNFSTVENGKVKFASPGSYRLLVFPGRSSMSPNGDRMSAQVSKKVNDLVKAGAIILLNGIDHDSAESSDAKGRIISGPFNDSSFKSLGFEPDVVIRGNGNENKPSIAWTHRAGEGFDIYFISNQENKAVGCELSFRINGRMPEIFDPLNGQIKKASAWKILQNRTIVPLRLEANGSLFVIFQQRTSLKAESRSKNWSETKRVQTINSPWKVNFSKENGGPQKDVIFQKLSDWSTNADTAIRYYSGTAVYSSTFNWKTVVNTSKQVFLNTGELANIAEIIVNGISCGITWTPPYRVDITKALKQGNNKLVIKVSNTWANRLIGDRRLPEENRITNTIAPYRLEGKPLLSAGLLGPVILERIE